MNITHGGCAIFSSSGLVRLREYKYQRLGDFHVETIDKGFLKKLRTTSHCLQCSLFNDYVSTANTEFPLSDSVERQTQRGNLQIKNILTSGFKQPGTGGHFIYLRLTYHSFN